MVCEKLSSRVSINMTHYRAVHEPETRVWVTLDKEEILSISKLDYIIKYSVLSSEISKLNDYDRKLRTVTNDFYKVYPQAKRILNSQMKYSEYEFLIALEEYINEPIESLLISDDDIKKALAMFDKRFGRRRIIDYEITSGSPELVKLFYRIRCGAENIKCKLDIH